MYNAEIKDKFLTEFTTNEGRRHAAKIMFDTLERFEEAWGADFCTKSKEDLEPVIAEIVGFRSSSRKLRFTIMKEYVKWCISNQVEGVCFGIFEIEDLGIDKLRRQMVANPQHLQRYLNCICDLESEETIDCILRCYYWLAYIGIYDEKIAVNILLDDVDLGDMVVRHAGKEYEIYREAIPAFRKCLTLNEFRIKNPNYAGTVYKNRAPGNTLLRGIYGNRPIRSLRSDMSRNATKAKYKKEEDKNDKSLDLRLSYFRVWLSGVFYRMYEAERAGMPPDFMEVAEQLAQNKKRKRVPDRKVGRYEQNRMAKEYLEDYNRWKEAYSI